MTPLTTLSTLTYNTITVKTKQLKEIITKSINGKGVYEDVLLKADSNILEVITADEDSYLSLSTVITNNDCNLSACVNKKTLANILKNIKDNTITLSLQEDNDTEYLIIKTEKANYRIKTTLNRIFEAYEDLPKEPKGKILLNGSAVAKAIDSVIYALSKDKIDLESYKSIGFIFEEKSKLIVAGTDGHRLAACYIDIEETDIENRFSIPKTSAMHLKKLLKDKDNVLFDVVESRSYYSKIAIFKGENFIFSTYLVNDNYPNITKVINDWRSHIKLNLKLSKDSIIDALNSFIVNKKDTYPIKLTLSNGNLNILSISDNSDVNIPVDYTGEEYTIGFNATYLLEAIDNICSNNIVIRLPLENNHPAYIEPANNCSCLAMIMPFKTE